MGQSSESLLDASTVALSPQCDMPQEARQTWPHPPGAQGPFLSTAWRDQACQLTEYQGLVILLQVVVSSGSIRLVQCWLPGGTPRLACHGSQSQWLSLCHCPENWCLKKKKSWEEGAKEWSAGETIHFDLNSLFRFGINQLVSMFNGNSRHYHIEIQIITPENSAGHHQI